MANFEDAKEETYTGVLDIKTALFGSLEGDKPLLEELGIDWTIIKSESMLPIRVLQNKNIANASTDLTGPIFILFVFAFVLVLHGKFHVSYIYLISLCSSFFIYSLINLLTTKSIRFSICCNIMGYALTPIVAFSLFNLLLVLFSPVFRTSLGAVAALWAAYTSSTVFCNHIETKDKLIVIGYPLFLVYFCFVMIVVF